MGGRMGGRIGGKLRNRFESDSRGGMGGKTGLEPVKDIDDPDYDSEEDWASVGRDRPDLDKRREDQINGLSMIIRICKRLSNNYYCRQRSRL